MLNIIILGTFPEILTLKEVFQIASNGKPLLLCTVISCNDAKWCISLSTQNSARFYVIIEKEMNLIKNLRNII